MLYDNQLTSVKGLEKLTQLRQLSLERNQLTSVKGLEKLTMLQELVLQDNPDLTKAQIDALQKALPNCKIDSNAPLTKEQSANYIEFKIRSKIKKYTGELTKADYEKVTVLNLSYSQLTSVKGLEKLTQLRQLDLSGTALTKAQIDELQKALPKCEIYSNFTK